MADSVERGDETSVNDLARRERELGEREAAVARTEARLEAAIAAQKEQVRTREREAEEVRAARAELADQRSRESEVLRRKERELEERERALRHRLDHEGGAAEAGDSARQTQLAERERALEQRILEVTKRELALAGASSSTASDALREREEAVTARGLELAARERVLEQRVRGVSMRELETARRHAEQQRALATSVPSASPAPAPAPAAPEREGHARWSLHELERVAAAEADESVERVEELHAYLHSLREYADYEGNLPAGFDALIEDVFGDALEQTA